MKIFRLLLLLAVLIFNFSFTNALECPDKKEKSSVACSVSNFVVTLSQCDSDSKFYNFTFSGTDFGLNGYTITTSNSSNVFNYTLNDYKVFSIDATCDDVVTITLADKDNPSCSLTYEIGLVCCPCFLQALVEQSQCDNYTFDATIEIYIDGTCRYYDPIFKINGIEYNSTFSNWKYHIDNIQIFGNDIVYEICYIVPDFETICYEIIYPNPCPPITNFKILSDSSKCTGDSLSVRFTFDGPYFGLYGFTVTSITGGNQTYNIGDEYIYKLPADCFEDVIISIFDNGNPTILVSDTIKPVCCPCNLKYNYELSKCTEGKFNINLKINEINGSCLNNDILLKMNGDTIILQDSSNIFWADNINNKDSLLIFHLCSLTPGSNICYKDTLFNPCFLPDSLTCQIRNFTLFADSNACSGELVTLNFGYSSTNFGINGYSIATNLGYYQNYALADTTLLSLIADCDSIVIVTITDANDSLCTATDTIGRLCCPCFPSFSVFTSACLNDSFSINFVIDSISGSCINYDWSLAVNGQNYDLSPTNTGYTSSALTSIDSLIVYELCALVPGLIECFRDTIINPCFQTTSNQCTISNFNVVVDSNSCTGEVIGLQFSFNGLGIGSNGYTLRTNTGYSQFFNPSDTKQFMLLADCSENIMVTITDANDSLCTAMDTVGSLCCPCLADVIITQSICANGASSANIMVNNIQGSCINYDWTLTINGLSQLLTPSNTGFSVSDIVANDSLLVYQLCNLVPEAPECYDYTMVNPCYNVPVSAEETAIENLVSFNKMNGELIQVQNKSGHALTFTIFNINGQQMGNVHQVPAFGSTTLDMSSWPSGIVIIKTYLKERSSTIKMVHIK